MCYVISMAVHIILKCQNAVIELTCEFATCLLKILGGGGGIRGCSLEKPHFDIDCFRF